MTFPKISLLTLAALAVASPAFAADAPRRQIPSAPTLAAPVAASGFYFGTRNGLAVADDTRFSVGGGATRVTNQYELGMSNGGMIGYNFGPVFNGVGLRGELEFNRSQFSIDSHKVNGAAVAGTDSFGELRAFSGLANGALDFNLGALSGAAPGSFLYRITPFVGGGVGYSQVELRKQGISATGVLIKDSDARLAYQVSAGVGVEVFDRTTLEIGYRYMAVPGLEFTARDGTKTKTELGANIVTIGMRRQF